MRQFEISSPNIAATQASTVRGKFLSLFSFVIRNYAKVYREMGFSLLYAYDSSVINDEEFVLLYDINIAPKSPDFPY